MKQSWTQGLDGYHRSMQPFEAHAIARALSELGDCILELNRARRRSRIPTCRTHDGPYQYLLDNSGRATARPAIG